jgi:hypothetical protein
MYTRVYMGMYVYVCLCTYTMCTYVCLCTSMYDLRLSMCIYMFFRFRLVRLSNPPTALPRTSGPRRAQPRRTFSQIEMGGLPLALRSVPMLRSSFALGSDASFALGRCFFCSGLRPASPPSTCWPTSTHQLAAPPSFSPRVSAPPPCRLPDAQTG